MSPILAFDIETIPDIQGIRILNHFDNSISDHDVAEWAMQQRRAQTGRDFMQHHLHKVIAISCCLRWGNDKIHVDTIGSLEDDEETIIAKFFDLIERYTPQLVSWNGGGFDLPVLHYRALINGISATRYWDNGDGEFADSRDFKWNNYTNRYHQRHCDLMDILSMFQARAAVPLDDMAKLCGFPGKLGMDGSQVWSAFQQGNLKDIRDYCETDAANTYLMFLRFELMRGSLDADAYQTEIKRAHEYLSNQSALHWQEFCKEWQY